MGDSERRKSTSLNMRGITPWLALALAIVTFTTPATASEPRVVCYYTNWSVYRPGTARFNPQNINPYLCTHLIYAFGGFTKDNTLKPFDKYQDIEKGGYAKFTGLKTYNKNLKTLLAIGGWNEGSSRFSPMVASRERRKEFVRNAIKFLRQNRFDGLDLDWEYPAFRDGGKPKDRENYAKLVRELREEFEREADKTGKPRLLLTMAVPAGIEYIQKGFDVKTLNQHLDWMNLLTYDYHSAFEPAVNHHAPLYPLEEPNEYSVDNELNIDYTIKFYIESGADPGKLVLGIPTYGRSYTLFNAEATDIGAPADGPGEQGDATREKGYLAYYEICEALMPKSSATKKRSVDSDEDEDDDDDDDEKTESEEAEDLPWTVVYPNAKAMGPVAYKGNQWVGYDDIDIVKKKAEYVAENGLGGIMFWSIDNDDFRGKCHSKPYPLIESAKEAYINKLGSTDNVVVKERPSAATSGSQRRRNRPRVTTTTTEKPAPAAKSQSNKRKPAASLSTTTPAWNIVTPEPPTTPDPGSDFKCKDEGFFPHPRDCKKYFWCLDSGPSNLGIVAHHFTCPSGLFFNKAADSCDFARNVPCKVGATTAAPATKAPATRKPTTEAPTTEAATTTRRAVRLSTKNSFAFRTTTTTTTTPEPEPEEDFDEILDDAEVDAEDPRVIKELIDLIKKVGGVEQLEKHLHLAETSMADGKATTTPATFNKELYQKVLQRTLATSKISNSLTEGQNSRRGPQNAGLDSTADSDKLLSRNRPQYKTISRSRASTAAPAEEDDDVEEPAVPEVGNQARAVEADRGTTAKPLQYVNIRRARPTSSQDTADDTASRNALFERAEPYVSVAETSGSLDAAGSRRDNSPEYVTIRRQRPTTDEATTAQYLNSESEESSYETVLEKELSSPPQPQYKSIVRARSTTTATPPEESNSVAPTTVLAVQISSLLNSPISEDATTSEAETATPETTETDPPTTTKTTTTTTVAPPKRINQRRRGTTTSTTASPITTTQQAPKRVNFPRRTKATAPPDAEPTTETIQDTTTLRTSTRRGNSKFKTRSKDSKKDTKEVAEKKEKDDGAKIENRTRQPSLNGGLKRSERPTRNYVRRRVGGANVTTTTTPTSALPGVSSTTRRPFRVTSRRRPLPATSSPSAARAPATTDVASTATAETSASETTRPATLATIASEESLQELEDRESLEEPALKPRIAPLKKTVKIQRRPLTSLKDTQEDQNPSATNEERKGQAKDPSSKEEDRKRQSKKYSSTFKQNQLDEVLRQKSKSQEEFDDTTVGAGDDYGAETAVAIAAHQLLAAPLPPPSPSDYEDEPKPKKKPTNSYATTQQYQYSSPEYTTVFEEDFVARKRTGYPSTQSPVYSSSAPFYRSTSFVGSQAFSSPTPGYASTSLPVSEFSKIPGYSSTLLPVSGYTSGSPKSAFSTPDPRQRPSGFTAAGFSLPPALGPSTARYLEASNKYAETPIDDFGYTNGGLSREPAYFTREYLLESPVTKTYDEEYQYLSPVTTTPSPATKKLAKKTVHRKISTTVRPTAAPAPAPVPSSPKPRRVTERKPFEKVKPAAKQEPGRTYRPIDNYDYYDDSQERLVGRHQEDTKVIVRGKGNIECLDIGNFPHPTSCKQFISCARMESGAIIGWEYLCPKGLSFDPVGGICNWSAGLGCDEN